MASIEFVCQDKDGIKILCTKEDWAHIIKHTECIEQKDLVKFVIEKPDSIYQDIDYKNRRVLYKLCVLPEPWGSCYVKVVIEYHMSLIKKVGWVCTAHAAFDKKEGEVLIWEKQT